MPDCFASGAAGDAVVQGTTGTYVDTPVLIKNGGYMTPIAPTHNVGAYATTDHKPSTTPLILCAILIVLGLIAIALPIAASISVSIVIGWIALLSGATQLVHAFKSHGIGHILWKVIV